MTYQTSLTINAPLDRVWSVLVDVESWPRSTTSITSVERLEHGPFGLGSRARIKQPKLPPFVWTVTEFVPPRQFTWTTRSPGVTTIAGHELAASADGSVRVTLSIRRAGPFAPLVDWLYGGLTREYVDLEIAGLKRVCESGTVESAV